MINAWKNLLPKEYLGLVIEPIFYESHMSPMTNAIKYIGFDTHARRCFYYHSIILTVDDSNDDEFPVLKSVSYEREVAWRLYQGGWVKVNSYTGWLDHCHNDIMTVPVETMRVILR